MTTLAYSSCLLIKASFDHREQTSTPNTLSTIFTEYVAFATVIFCRPSSYYTPAPILGDKIYSRKPIDSTIMNATAVPNPRVFLHGAEISFFVCIFST